MKEVLDECVVTEREEKEETVTSEDPTIVTESNHTSGSEMTDKL
jgi:hypothetical protein